MKIRISVITPSLNKAKYIEAAIKSVTAQDYGNFEHIIIDGGSTDGTLDILEKHPHLKWISEPDTGQSDAMNKGFSISSGDIIVYLNADDYLLPNAFKTVLQHFKNGSTFVVGQVKVIMDDGKTIISNPKVSFLEMLKWWETDSYCCNPVGYFYLKEVQEAVGGFNVMLHHSMDYEFLLEASRKFSFKKIDSVLGVFRLTAETKTLATQHRHYDIKFDFCNKYLTELDKDYVRKYTRERDSFLKQAAETKTTIAIQECLDKNRYIDALSLSVRLFFKNPSRFFRSAARYCKKKTTSDNLS